MNRACVITSNQNSSEEWSGQFSGNWKEDYEETNMPTSNLLALMKLYKCPPELYWTMVASTAIVLKEWESAQIIDVATSREYQKGLLVSQLGWTIQEILETRMRLSTFEKDWNAPGMEAYDEL